MLKYLLGASSAVLAAIPIAGATAQTVQAREIQLSISAGDLSSALIALGREAQVQIIFTPESVKGRTVAGLRGRMTVDAALSRLLKSSGLSFRKISSGAYVVSGPGKTKRTSPRPAVARRPPQRNKVPDLADIPEILVVGQRNWSLNTDIARSKDEAQPYTVFSREEIKRSGAADLDTFFRDYLTANVSVSTAGQRAARDSQINLRGLGLDATLILVDGRRIAEPNVDPNSLASGDFIQSSIMGIPLDQIERVELLASSAAGQYGSNAVGGVINIVLRREFHGLELTGRLGGTTDWRAIERRLSANATIPLVNDTFSATASANWVKASPLFTGDRPFVRRRSDHILANNPDYYENASPTSGLVYSTSPNIVAAGNGNLTLKPEYAPEGNADLGSAITFIPVGFQGRSIVGNEALGAALRANAGKLNTAPGPGNTGGLIFGDRAQLIGGSETLSLSLAARGDLTDWLAVYASGFYSRYRARIQTSLLPATLQFEASSPVNPFNEPIAVTIPSESRSLGWSTMASQHAVGGLILTLPNRWRGNLDASRSVGTTSSDFGRGAQISSGYATALASGTIDVLVDTLAYPLTPEFGSAGSHARHVPSRSSATAYTVKVAGPLGFARLPGGAPTLTVVAERRKQAFGDSVFIDNSPLRSSVRYSPGRSLSTNAIFGELVLPVVGASNNLPLVRDLEIRLAARYDKYTGVGTNARYTCLANVPGFLSPAQIEAACPAPGVTVPFITTRSHSINPVVAAKWSLTPDLSLRGSYSTGYTPPRLSALVEDPPLRFGFAPHIRNFLFTTVTDPQRGDERIGENILNAGVIYGLDGVTGGNPDVAPQKSTSWSVGALLTPTFLPGLALRADWTQITIRNAYFNPRPLLLASTREQQAAFEDFLAANPQRFTRAAPAPGDPYSSGPIVYIDARQANFSYLRSEAVDFSGDYRTDLGNGNFSLAGNATLLIDLTRRLTLSTPPVKMAGVAAATDIGGVGNSLRFRGTLTARYWTDNWEVGFRARHFSGYYLQYRDPATGEHPQDANQGANRIDGTTFFDLFGSQQLRPGFELRWGIDNIFNTRPPTDVTRGLGYAPYGDPRLRSFFVSLTHQI